LKNTVRVPLGLDPFGAEAYAEAAAMQFSSAEEGVDGPNFS